MAHYAELDENNVVKQIIVVHNNELLDEDGNESEQKGLDFVAAHYPGTWLRTSFNRNIRANYAMVGGTYDPETDRFIDVKPFPSWVLNNDVKWEPPMPKPVEEGKLFVWDEPTLSWVEVVLPA